MEAQLQLTMALRAVSVELLSQELDLLVDGVVMLLELMMPREQVVEAQVDHTGQEEEVETF